MKSGAKASFNAAAPLEIYPGEPSGDCLHGVPDGNYCPECRLDFVEQDLLYESGEADYWHDRYQELAVIADALACSSQ